MPSPAAEASARKLRTLFAGASAPPAASSSLKEPPRPVARDVTTSSSHHQRGGPLTPSPPPSETSSSCRPVVNAVQPTPQSEEVSCASTSCSASPPYFSSFPLAAAEGSAQPKTGLPPQAPPTREEEEETEVALYPEQQPTVQEQVEEESPSVKWNPKTTDTINENDTKTDFIATPVGTRKRKVSAADFIFLRVLGKGSYGTVMLVKGTFDNGIYAMKMLRKDNIVRRHQVQHTRTERAVLESIRHPFIVELYYAFQTPKKLYFVMEYCPGGELFFHLSRANRFSEQRVRFYAAEIILALEFLHKLNIVYRDLKPENVLLDAEGHVRLTDFGLSKGGIADNFSTKSFCGTPEYLAPEVLNQQGHGKAVDWWSLGALIYEMLTGLPPFYSKDRDRLFDNIRSGELRFPSCVSPTARDLLIRLFNRNPDRRLGGSRRDAAEVKEHPFFANVNWDDVYHKRLTPPFRPKLKSGVDVSYFDHDFIKLPIENSEATESLMGDAAREMPRDELFPGFTYEKSNAYV